MSAGAQKTLLLVLGAVLVLFLLLPLLALGLTTGLEDFVAGLKHPLVWPALRLSLLTSGGSLLLFLLLGTPLAWMLSRGRSRLSSAIELLVRVPIVLPPAVAGVALLLAFGRRGLLSELIPSPAFTSMAVVLAQLFVSGPLYVQAATSAFRRIDPELLLVARSFGASPLRVFAQVALPMSLSALMAGAAMGWARALGEFGATLLFAGNLVGRTQTLPLAIYSALESDLRVAQSLSLVLVLVAFSLLLGTRALARRALGEER